MSIKFSCPKCGKAIVTKKENAGKTGKCPQCGSELIIPLEVGGEAEVVSNSLPEDRGHKYFNILGPNIELLGDPMPEDEGFVKEFSEAVERIGKSGAVLMQLDFSKSEYRNKNRLPIITIAKKILRKYNTQLQINLTGLWK